MPRTIGCFLCLTILSLLSCCQHSFGARKEVQGVPDIAATTVPIHDTDSADVKELKRLFNDRDTDGFIKYWEKSGLTPNFEDTYGRGFIHWVVGANVRADVRPLITISPINMYFTSQHEAATNWDKKDVTGHTGLHYAVMHDMQEIAQLYHARGAKPATQNNRGKNSLHMAAERGYRGMMTQLLSGSEDQPKVNADALYAVDDEGMTPLHYAATRNDGFIAEVLAKAAQRPEHYVTHRPAGFPNVPSPFQASVASSSDRGAEVFLDLIDTDVHLIAPDPNGNLPLQVAAALGSERIVKMLVDRFRKSSVSLACASDAEGRNALHFAARYGHVEVIRRILRYLPRGEQEACITKTAVNGWTPLHYAARYNYNKVVDYILKLTKASVSKVEANGLTPLDLAALGCRLRQEATVIKLLIRAGAAEGAAGIRSSKYAHDICVRKQCQACIIATRDRVSPEYSITKYPPKCEEVEDRSPFRQPGLTKTLGGTRDCGIPRVERGRQLCFYVEVIDYTGFPSPSLGRPIGLGIVVDEFLISVTASMFVAVEKLFGKKVLSPNGQYAIRTRGHEETGGIQGRYVTVVGGPVVHPNFRPDSTGYDLAYLNLSESITEFRDGICFLCLPTDEVAPNCLENCFVISPNAASKAKRVNASTESRKQKDSPWEKYAPTVLTPEFCQHELGPMGFATDENSVCVENRGSSEAEEDGRKFCGTSSSILVCQRNGAVRLYGHQLYPKDNSTQGRCDSSAIHGVFSSLQTTESRSFYRTATDPVESRLLFGDEVLPLSATIVPPAKPASISSPAEGLSDPGHVVQYPE